MEYNNYLYHHGTKGMKWGRRRYQNKDGSLTPAGKKRYSEEYKKHMQKAQSDQHYAQQSLYIKSHNQTADEYNSHKIAEYNKTHSPDDKDYVDAYNKQFADDWKRNYTKLYVEFTKNNKNYQKGKAIADKYNLYSFDELAKNNKRAMEAMEAYAEGSVSYEDTLKETKYRPD